MRKIQFLSVDELKESSPIQTNLDEKILNQCILEFQEIELEDILGRPLYQRLNNELVNGATIDGYTYSTTDNILLDKIKPVMIYGALLYSLTPLHFKITNKGVQKLTDGNSVAGASTDIEVLKSNYTFKLDRYKKILVNHLEYLERETKDKEYNVPNDIDTSFSFSGISIPDFNVDEEEFYKSQAYKTGYYRRIIY